MSHRLRFVASRSTTPILAELSELNQRLLDASVLWASDDDSVGLKAPPGPASCCSSWGARSPASDVVFITRPKQMHLDLTVGARARTAQRRRRSSSARNAWILNPIRNGGARCSGRSSVLHHDGDPRPAP